MTSYHHAYRGVFAHTPSPSSIQIFHDYRLVVDQHGIIVSFNQASLPSPPVVSWTTETLIPDGSFILPTFCDLHLHAPQYLYQGNGLDLPLMQWLDTYALKAEEQLDSDRDLAKEIYKTLARRLLKSGTGAVLLFGTIKEDTNMILAEEMQNAGIRAFVGKLSMDISSRQTYVEPSAQISLDSARSFVSRCRALTQELAPHERRVEPVLTPRFVPTCSDELLHGLGELSEKEGLKIQSHLAEAHDEIEMVRKERGMEDIDVFEKHSLLTPRTIQAHCTFLSPPDLSRIRDHGTAIAHCPLSNVYFSAEPFRLREALDRGVKVGLGTDIAGGYSVDIMSAMRQAVAVSRMRQGKNITSRIEQSPDGGEGERSLGVDWKESLYLATRGGSIALGLDSGVFKVGAPFDAQTIAVCDNESGEGVGALDFFTGGGPKLPLNEDIIEKWWCIGDDRNRRTVWVQGKQVAL